MTSTTYPSHADVVIVGSGPAGAAYARILSERSPELTIAMFEVGPQITNPPGDHVKNIVSPEEKAAAQAAAQGPERSHEPRTPIATADGRAARPGTYLLSANYQLADETGLPAAAFSSNVGGMGAHWTCACPRPGGSERIGFLPELDELLDDAERILAVTSHAMDDFPFARDVRSKLAGVYDAEAQPGRQVQGMPLAVTPQADGRLTWSGPAVVFGDITRSNPNFQLFAESLVTKVTTAADGAVTGVEVRDRSSGEVSLVQAPVVVVAADALRTPQVLFASGIRPWALGRWLNDQPQVVYAARLPVDAREAEAPSSSEPAIARESGVSWVPFSDDRPFHGQVMQMDASPVKLAADDVPEPGTIVALGWFCAKDLQESDRVTFSESDVDSYGMPAMSIHYTLTENDYATIERAKADLRIAAAAVGTPLGTDPFMLPAGSSLHYQGSVRMGTANDGLSVCDTSSEVWDHAGLFVAGNGVIPTSTACNPTLTSVALAIGGARAIAERLGARGRV